MRTAPRTPSDEHEGTAHDRQPEPAARHTPGAVARRMAVARAGRAARRRPRARREGPDAYWTWVAEQQRWLKPVDLGAHRRDRRLPLLRRRPDERRRQLRGPVGRGPGHGRQAGGGLGGRAGRVPHGHLRRAGRRGQPARRRARRSSGSARATSSAIYMPNAVEAFTAVHACNRIGAIYTILFSGFGAGGGRAPAGGRRAPRWSSRSTGPTAAASSTPLLETLRAARGRERRWSTRSSSTAPAAASRSRTGRSPTPTRSPWRRRACPRCRWRPTTRRS